MLLAITLFGHLSQWGQNMNDLIIVEKKVPYAPNNKIYRIIRRIVKWALISFASICMVVGFSVISLWVFVLFEEQSSDMTGIGNCGTPKCIDQ